MKLFPLFLGFYLFTILITDITNAQTDDIAPIRSFYAKIANEIAACKTDGEGEYQCTLLVSELNVNAYNQMVPVVATSTRNVKFWMAGKDFLTGNEELYNDFDLARVDVKGQLSAFSWYEEYLFDKGKLIFYIYKSEAGEYRYYFKNNKLIKFLDKKLAEPTHYLIEEERTQQQWLQIVTDAQNYYNCFKIFGF